MTAVSMDLDEDEVYATRHYLSEWCQTTQDGPMTRTFKKLLAALPRLEPKAGGTCRPWIGGDIRPIHGVAAGFVWVSHDKPGPGTVMPIRHFKEMFEVVS